MDAWADREVEAAAAAGGGAAVVEEAHGVEGGQSLHSQAQNAGGAVLMEGPMTGKVVLRVIPARTGAATPMMPHSDNGMMVWERQQPQ